MWASGLDTGGKRRCARPLPDAESHQAPTKKLPRREQRQGSKRLVEPVVLVATSDTSRVFGSAVIETVDQECRVLMNAGHAPPALAGTGPEIRTFQEQI